MKTIPQVLLDAAALIERGWTRGAEAQDDQSRIVDARSPDAVRWCATGAILRSSGEEMSDYTAAMDRMRSYLLQQYNERSVYAWNDAFSRESGPLVAQAMREAAQG